MFEHMRAGDWIVITFGVIGIGRWVFDGASKVWNRHNDHGEELDERVNRYRSEFLVHQATDESEFKWIKETMGRMERKIDNLQAQIRNVATSSSNKVFHTDKED